MLRIKDWMEYQHYKDRNPPWVKLHKKLMTSFDWHSLHNDSKVLALNLWWLASEHTDATSGLITDNMQRIAFKSRMEETRVIECIRELVRHGFVEFIDDDSDLLSRCYQDATPETETETDSESESPPTPPRGELKKEVKKERKQKNGYVRKPKTRERRETADEITKRVAEEFYEKPND